MKKILAIALSLIMVLSLSFAVFAEDIAPNGDGSGDVDVQVKDKDGNLIEDYEKVYSIAIEWDSLVFNFKADQGADELQWDPDTHSYANLTGAWEDNVDREISITNHSNDAVAFAAAFSGNVKVYTKSGVTAYLNGDDGTLATAEGTLVVDAPSYSYFVILDDESVPTMLKQFTVDTVTITLSQI